MKDPTQPIRIEPRWPAALAILAVLLLLTVLPGRVRLLPVWVPFVVVAAVLLPMAGVALAATRARWLRVERAIMLLFVALMGVATLSILAYLVRTMVSRPGDIGGLQLLTSSIAVWVTNVLVFSLLFWHIDRGGPEARANDAGTKPDWLFPQSGAPEDAPPDWRPTFVDYIVPRVLDGNGVQLHRRLTADVPRQDADDARKLDLALDAGRRRVTRDQHPGRLDSVEQHTQREASRGR